MNRPVRTGKDFDEARARILGAAEKQFRRVGYHRTSVADIGMSPANIYRFFPSRDAINESICGRVVNEIADIAFAIARTNAPSMDKLDRLLTAVHHHAKMMLVEARPMHELVVAATQENWPIIQAHIERMVTIFEAIIRSGLGKPAFFAFGFFGHSWALFKLYSVIEFSGVLLIVFFIGFIGALGVFIGALAQEWATDARLLSRYSFE